MTALRQLRSLLLNRLKEVACHQFCNEGISEVSNGVVASIVLAMEFSGIESFIDLEEWLRNLIVTRGETRLHRAPEIVHQAVAEAVGELPSTIKSSNLQSCRIVEQPIVQGARPFNHVIMRNAMFRSLSHRRLKEV